MLHMFFCILLLILIFEVNFILHHPAQGLQVIFEMLTINDVNYLLIATECVINI